jgi:hypothetical protein
MRHRQASLVSPRAARLVPRAARRAPRASSLSPRPSRLAPLILIPCDHPAWSPRAARGVGRVPLRFLTALGMTRMRHRQASLVSPRASRLAPRAARRAPRPSRRARGRARPAPIPRCARNDTHAASSSVIGITRASRLAPRASSLAPRASSLAPRASRLVPRASRLVPRASRLVPRASRLSYQFPVTIRHGHPAPRAGSGASRADSSLRSE